MVEIPSDSEPTWLVKEGGPTDIYARVQAVGEDKLVIDDLNGYRGPLEEFEGSHAENRSGEDNSPPYQLEDSEGGEVTVYSENGGLYMVRGSVGNLTVERLGEPDSISADQLLERAASAEMSIPQMRKWLRGPRHAGAD